VFRVSSLGNGHTVTHQQLRRSHCVLCWRFYDNLYSGQQMPSFGVSQGRSRHRRCGGAPTSGRWARGLVRTNVSHSAAGSGCRDPQINGICLIQNPAFLHSAFLCSDSVLYECFYQYSMHWGERKTVVRGCRMRPEMPKIEAEVWDLGRVIIYTEGAASHTG